MSESNENELRNELRTAVECLACEFREQSKKELAAVGYTDFTGLLVGNPDANTGDVVAIGLFMQGHLSGMITLPKGKVGDLIAMLLPLTASEPDASEEPRLRLVN